jgi:hypothetical protein
MRRLPCIPVVVLLSCTVMSAACGAQEKGLSGDRVATDNGVLVIHPVHHATFLMQWNGKTIYVDPIGGVKPFADLPKPDLVLVTHIHFDHFDPATLAAIVVRAWLALESTVSVSLTLGGAEHERNAYGKVPARIACPQTPLVPVQPAVAPDAVRRPCLPFGDAPAKPPPHLLRSCAEETHQSQASAPQQPPLLPRAGDTERPPFYRENSFPSASLGCTSFHVNL